MIDRGLKRDWAKAAEGYMRENPRDFPSATSVDAIETFIEKKIDPKLTKLICADIYASSLVGETTSKEILRILLNQAADDAKIDSTVPERKNTGYQTARALLASLEQDFK